MIRVTLHNAEDDELVLGPFSQGVVLDPGINAFTAARMFDLATRKEVARLKNNSQWFVVNLKTGSAEKKSYKSCFAQEVPLSEQRDLASRALDALVRKRPHCGQRRGFCDHEHCRRIEQARARLEELT